LIFGKLFFKSNFDIDSCQNEQDPWWNPAVEEQAVMRIRRIGQTKKVAIKVSNGLLWRYI
jgi:hypothetical protein